MTQPESPELDYFKRNHVALLESFYDSVFALVDDMYDVGIKPKEIEKLLIRDVKYMVKSAFEK